MLLVLVVIISSCAISVNADFYSDCGKLFNPLNYMRQLPSLSMPYVSSVPSIVPKIRPSKVSTTTVLKIVTEYAYQNPVCVKVTGAKPPCKPLNPENLDSIVTKEVFIGGQKNQDLGLYIQGSKDPRPFKISQKTPELPEHNEILIEDRLDHLEDILPGYTRRRVFETSTLTVTKTSSNNRVMATLLAKNCVPQGFDLCPPKTRRKSKVARFNSNNTLEEHFFG